MQMVLVFEILPALLPVSLCTSVFALYVFDICLKRLLLIEWFVFAVIIAEEVRPTVPHPLLEAGEESLHDEEGRQLWLQSLCVWHLW